MTEMYDRIKAEVRRAKDAETLKTAENYRQRWTADEDEIVLAREEDDMSLAVTLGRTFSSVIQRRSVLHKMLASGLSLPEIHVVEAQRLEAHNRKVYADNMAQLQDACPECFCTPHASWCSRVA